MIPTSPLEWNVTQVDMSQVPELDENGIHLILVDITEARDGLDESVLTAAELDRVSRISNDKLRQNYIRARAMLKFMLCHYISGTPGEIEFEYGAYGKPFLESSGSKRRLQFNYSDCGGKVLYAFAWNRELGVDLEILPRKISQERLAKRIFSDEEMGNYKDIERQMRSDVLIACWTRKEAFGKAIGVGIRYPLNQAAVFLDTDSETFTITSANAARWSAGPIHKNLTGIQLSLPIKAAATLVYHGEPARLSAFSLQ